MVDNPAMGIYVNKVWKRIELVTVETINLLASTKSKIIKDENREKVSRLEITEVVLINCNIVNSNCE